MLADAQGATRPLGILIDQNVTADRGIFIDFFGIKACVDSGFAQLAAHSEAAVIPGYALWSEQERRYVLHFDPPVPITGDTLADTQAIHVRPRARDPPATRTNGSGSTAAGRPVRLEPNRLAGVSTNGHEQVYRRLGDARLGRSYRPSPILPVSLELAGAIARHGGLDVPV